MLHSTLTNGVNQFSYEDMGSYELSFWLCLSQVIVGALLAKSYFKNIYENDRYFSPHPIMLASLAALIFSLILETVHLN
jgi:hypothetical protein